MISTDPFYDFMQCVLMDMYYTLFDSYRKSYDISYNEKINDLEMMFECNKPEGFEFKRNIEVCWTLEQWVKQLTYGMPPHAPGVCIQYQINSLFLQDKFGDYFELQIPNDNELPYVNTRYFDRFFRLIRIEEIIALYTCLLAENKTILVVCDHPQDLIPIVTTLQELFHPFEWSLPRIPFLVVQDPEDTDNPLFEMINNIQMIILGVQTECYESIRYKMAENEENLQQIVVLELIDLVQDDYVQADD